MLFCIGVSGFSCRIFLIFESSQCNEFSTDFCKILVSSLVSMKSQSVVKCRRVSQKFGLLHFVRCFHWSQSVAEFWRHVSMTITSRTFEIPIIPRPKCELGRTSIRHRGPLTWNYVPREVRENNNINSFKKQLRTCKLENIHYIKEAAIGTNKDSNYFYY